ncbi:MAG: HEAT repeat domain-containing protein [Planctomycetota bacterium]|nr:HEAT repeat domain-containing protein [Planctomycetota bacterium]
MISLLLCCLGAFSAPLATGPSLTAGQESPVDRVSPDVALTRLVDGDLAGPARVELARGVAEGLPVARVLEALPLLVDRDPEVRAIAASLLSRPDLGVLASRERVDALTRVAGSDSDRRVIEAAVEALGQIGGPGASAALGRLAVDDVDAVAEAAARALAGAADALEPLRDLVRRSTATEGRPRAAVLAALLPRYGQWLADDEAATAADHAPLVFSLRHPSPEVRRAAREAFDRLISRLIDSAVPGRASALLGKLGELGIERDVALYQRARICLAAEGDAAGALVAARELVRSRGLLLRPSARTDAFESQLWLFRGLYLKGVAEIALGEHEAASASLSGAAGALDVALSERRDLLSRPERLRHVDLLHQRAVIEVARTLAVVARGDSGLAALERARFAHLVHLEAQAVFAEIEGDVTTGWDGLLAADLSPYRLLFGRRGFAGGASEGSTVAALDRATIVRLEGTLGRVLATVSPGELPGFEPIEGAAGSVLLKQVTDPLADDQRRELFERIRAARLSGLEAAIEEADAAYRRAQRRAPGLLPEREFEALQRLQRRRMVAAQAIQQEPRGGAPGWVRDLRIPGSAALWFAQDLTEEGRGVEARLVASRMERDIEARGISNWWFYVGHERIARAQLLQGSAFTDEGRGEDAEEVLLRAVERIEDIQKQLLENGASPEALSGFRNLQASALVSLAVNANVRLQAPDRARSYYERAYELRKDEFMRTLLACYRARSGAETEARALLRTIRPGPGTWYNLACTHALLGDVEEALGFLKSELELNHASLESRARQQEWAAEDPDLASLRDDPRFRRLVRVD